MARYSIFSLLGEGITGTRHEVWREPELRKSYDVVIIGGGGHGLATAYYLAKNHGVRNVAVLEKGYIGGGNAGRNTTIIRSNYMIDGNTQFYDFSLGLWEGLSQELNFNVMFGARGYLTLASSPESLDRLARLGNIMVLNGIEARLLSRLEVEKMVPYIDFSKQARFPIFGALIQPKAGTARHDAVVWGYARAADQQGVDIIQNCQVTDLVCKGGRIVALETTRGTIGAERVGIAVAGHTSQLARMAGIRLPIESYALQAFVTEAVKPCIDNILVYEPGHLYISQSDKGSLVFGAHLDQYSTYAGRGNLPKVRDVMESAVALAPFLGRLRVLRHWGGVMDMTPDGSPIIAPSPIDGLYLNGGWCYGGFKATPASGWCFAHTIVNNASHELIAKFTIERFANGDLLDESGKSPHHYEQ